MTERPYTTGLYMLRCLEVGLHPSDLHLLDMGTVTDILVESGNDHCEYQEVADQRDFDRF